MKRTQTRRARPRMWCSVALLLSVVVLHGCQHVPRHTDAIVTESSRSEVSGAPPVVVPIPKHHIVWSVPGDDSGAVHSIVGTIRLASQNDSVVVADEPVPFQFEDFTKVVPTKTSRYQYTFRQRAEFDLYECEERWVFRLADGTTLASDTFTGPLRSDPGAGLDDCRKHAVAFDDWEPGPGHPVWRKLMRQRPEWLMSAASVRLREFLVVHHLDPYEPWLYRRSDGVALMALPAASKSNQACSVQRWAPSQALITSCTGTRWRDGRIARHLYFAKPTQDGVTWHDVDDGEPFPDGMWLVDGSSCPEYRGCVRDGSTRKPIDWREDHELLISSPYGPVDRGSAVSRTYDRWYMTVHGSKRMTPCSRSKVGCMKRTGPTRLLITDLSTGDRRWVPVDGVEDLTELEHGSAGFLPRWGLDGSIWATAHTFHEGVSTLAALYVGSASGGLSRRALPAKADGVQFIDGRRGVAWSRDRFWWSADGAKSWNEVSDLPDAFDPGRGVSCAEYGCMLGGIWLDWSR